MFEANGRRRFCVRERPITHPVGRSRLQPTKRSYFHVEQRRKKEHQWTSQQCPDQAHQQVESWHGFAYRHRRHHDERSQCAPFPIEF